MRLMPSSPSLLFIIAATGFAATIAQIIILRELLVLFYGNELSAGLIFAGWLLWSGLGSGLSGKWVHKFPSQTSSLGVMFVSLAAILPLSVLFIRATRIFGMLPFGELPSMGKMLLVSLFVTGLFCPLTGALFGFCWARYWKESRTQPLGIYIGEALGAATGGLIFYFVFLPYGSAFSAIWITSGMILFVSWWLFRPWLPVSRMHQEGQVGRMFGAKPIRFRE